MFHKKSCSQKFRNIHRKTVNARNFIKEKLQCRCFPVKCAKFLRTPFFTYHLWWLLLQWECVNKLVNLSDFWLVNTRQAKISAECAHNAVNWPYCLLEFNQTYNHSPMWLITHCESFLADQYKLKVWWVFCWKPKYGSKTSFPALADWIAFQ